MQQRVSRGSRRRTTERVIGEARNWAEFWDRLVASKDAAQQGAAFERLTQLLLQTQPEYQSKLKHVWLLSEVPEKVRAKLRLPQLDEGIDLVAETHEGTFWAIQSKFRSDIKGTLTRKKLDTFTSLAFVACTGISLAVVAHTSSKVIRKRHLMGNTVEIGLDRFAELDETHWSLITAALSGRPARPEARTPRPHQEQAVAAALRHYRDKQAKRGRLIMPCGTGKSLTAFWIAEALQARNILVAVPSLALVRQSLEDWTREYLARLDRPDWLCVCSDESVGVVENDSFVAETYDLGIPTTTDQDEIARFLAKRTTGHRITFTTYQSSGKVAQAARTAGVAFDLAVLDEAHKTVGVASKMFANLLRNDVPIRRRLFMTATERVLKGENDEVLSMDDEAVYGERFFNLTFKDAIAERIISDYRILTIMVSDERVQEIIRENRLLDLSPDDITEAEAQAVAAGIALKRVFQEHGIKHAISFHRSIRGADRFREQQDRLNGLTEVGPPTVNQHISSKKSAGQRSELLRSFAQHERALMTNARCLTEGVDIPAIDCVLFADPKQSVIDIVQAAGRALRRAPGKEFGYVLIPLVIPSNMEFDAFTESTAFRQVARTITALSTQDERIAEQFRAIEHGRKLTGRIIDIKGDVTVGLKLSLAEFADAISARVWEQAARANWRPFELARDYARSLGLRSAKEWAQLSRSKRLPPDIPAAPDRTYFRTGWRTWGDWLGTFFEAVYLRRYRTFESAREYARSLGLSSVQEWRERAKAKQLPADIPAHPPVTYKLSGWSSWPDWLGNKNMFSWEVPFRRFAEARLYARSLALTGQSQWFAFARSDRRPADIPYDPAEYYADKGWQSWGDWLGTDRRRRGAPYLPFSEARKAIRAVGLRSQQEWSEYRKSGRKPPDIPSSPHMVYAGKGWAG